MTIMSETVKTRKPKDKFCEFSIIVDTREQYPWTFHNLTTMTYRFHVSSSRGTLKQGDYAIEGMESMLAIERKSMEDLFGTLSTGRDRFARELERIQQDHRMGAVVVEASWEMISSPQRYRSNWRSKLLPQSVVGTVQSWMIRYPRVHWCFLPTRSEAEWMAFQLMRFAYSQRIHEVFDDE